MHTRSFRWRDDDDRYCSDRGRRGLPPERHRRTYVILKKWLKITEFKKSKNRGREYYNSHKIQLLRSSNLESHNNVSADTQLPSRENEAPFARVAVIVCRGGGGIVGCRVYIILPHQLAHNIRDLLRGAAAGSIVSRPSHATRVGNSSSFYAPELAREIRWQIFKISSVDWSRGKWARRTRKREREIERHHMWRLLRRIYIINIIIYVILCVICNITNGVQRVTP